MSTEFQQQQRAWVEANPLRAWRKQEKVSLFQTAGLLGVTLTAIQAWESGANKPTDENMAKIAQLTGQESIGGTWDAWKQAAPKL